MDKSMLTESSDKSDESENQISSDLEPEMNRDEIDRNKKKEPE